MESEDNDLEIPVTYQGEELSFPAKFIMTGYTNKIRVDVNEQQIMFEPDEEKNYRPVLTNKQLEKGAKVDINLLREIATVINSVIR